MTSLKSSSDFERKWPQMWCNSVIWWERREQWKTDGEWNFKMFFQKAGTKIAHWVAITPVEAHADIFHFFSEKSREIIDHFQKNYEYTVWKVFLNKD